MRKMDEVDIFIRDYFNEKLSNEDAQIFQNRYKDEPDFKKLADQIELEVLGVRSHGRQHLKSKFQSWETEKNEEGLNQNIQPFPWLKTGIAASILIALIFVGKTVLSPADENLFLTYYEPYPNFEYTTTRDNKEELNTPKYLAYSNYDQGNFTKAEQHFNELLNASPNDAPTLFFRGLSRIELKSYKAAIRDFESVIISNHSYYKDPAQWYLSLLHIKLGNIQAAQGLLKELSESQDYNEKAKMLAKEISLQE